MQSVTASCATGDPEPMEDRADNGGAAHVPGCGLADNIDVRLARLTQLFYCGALQVSSQLIASWGLMPPFAGPCMQIACRPVSVLQAPRAAKAGIWLAVA